MQTKLFIKLALSAAVVFTASTSFAQDSTKRKSVNITSTFKPVLKDAAKINFNASPPTADTSRPRLQYNIPNQNLLMPYQPGSLRPLALQIDTLGVFNNQSYVKAGFGTLKTPYLETGITLGDGKTAGFTLYGRHISSEGKRPYQKFANTNIDATAFYQVKNLEWDGRIGNFQETYYKYGYQPDTLAFSKDSLKVKFQTWRGRVSFHNINQTQYGISYQPEVKMDVFHDQLNNNETNTYINLPMQKSVGRVFEVDVAASADLTHYRPKAKSNINNSIFALTPTILFKTPNAFLHVGIKPSWNNGTFKLFPNVMAEISTTDQRLALQLGWIGYVRKTSYQYLAGINPWIWPPTDLLNTSIEERYVGIKGAAGNNLNYSAKLGYDKYNNQPLFVNDTMSGKSFMVVNESQMKVIHVDGEVGYTIGEKFSWISKVTVNHFMNLTDNRKAYGLLPIEVNSNVRIQVMKDLFIKGDLYAYNGTWYRTKSDEGKSSGSVDLGAGAEFTIVKNVKLWAQFNNIFNNQYQRWNQYPVYGFNFMGGVVFSFAQNKK